jgi:Arc/MetJ-type ribon-helix-helix transcriptional regulator
MNVTLSKDLCDFVREKVDRGQFPSEEAVLQEAVRRFRQEEESARVAVENPISSDLVDDEAIEYCTRAVNGKEVPSIEDVRVMLSKIPGSMAQAVIDERASRP